ncbi:hypothetical protein VTK56DRAFT_1064 [Thermocarpiscus australiensis]
MATFADSAGYVEVALSADGSAAADLSFPERRIKLNRNKNSIVIGRASKLSSKGFVAALDNAWFDCAVMSRQHAEIVADMEAKRVEVRDLSSLHGTFLNGSEGICVKGFRELKDGDTLTFGVPIWRGPEKFTPITVKVGISFSDRGGAGTNTFQVPDGSDDDDLSDMDDRPGSGGPSLKKTNGPSQSVPDNRANSQVNIIDLTNAHGGRSVHKDQVHRESPRGNIIDLSSPPGSPIPVDDDDDEDGSASVIECQVDEVEDIADVHGEFSPASSELSGPVYRQSTNEAASVFGGDTPAMPVMPDMPDLEYYRPPLPPSMDEDNTALDNYSNEDRSDGTSVQSDETESHTDYDTSSKMDEDDENEHKDDTESEEEYTSDDDGFGTESLEDSSDFRNDLRQSPSAIEYPEISAIVDSLSSLSKPVVPTRPSEPNEAAAKSTAPVSIDELLNDHNPQSPVCVPLHNEPVTQAPEIPAVGDYNNEASPPSSFYTAPPSFTHPTTTSEVLGPKTGKFDFFVAREENKMTINAQKDTKPQPASSVHALCNEEKPENYVFAPAGRRAEKCSEEGLNLPRPIKSAEPSSSVRQFLPVEFPLGYPRRIPLDPSGPYYLPPLNMDGETDGRCRRTHVGISDIVDTRQQQILETGKPKRKADEISDTTKDEEFWATAAAAAEHINLMAFDAARTRETPVAGRTSSPVPPAVVKQLRREPAERGDGDPSIAKRPRILPEGEVHAKRARLMHIAERAAYAALGGVTAGAMIVGTLIYTAPTFG